MHSSPGGGGCSPERTQWPAQPESSATRKGRSKHGVRRARPGLHVADMQRMARCAAQHRRPHRPQDAEHGRHDGAGRTEAAAVETDQAVALAGGCCGGGGVRHLADVRCGGAACHACCGAGRPQGRKRIFCTALLIPWWRDKPACPMAARAGPWRQHTCPPSPPGSVPPGCPAAPGPTATAPAAVPLTAPDASQPSPASNASTSAASLSTGADAGLGWCCCFCCWGCWWGCCPGCSSPRRC